MEEIFFRGILYSTIKSFLGPWVSALIVAVIFALVHQTWSNLLPLFLMSLLLTWLYERNGRLLAPIAYHAVNNAVTFSMVYISHVTAPCAMR